ncbi:MAG TPA: 4'-phosphopantetheinyl transferase superfamily protein [Longimicrobiaceae bacterium]|jgi:4'-phosphopantetheinyl transferase|nr:4'-phosphopantetheinyl transferase superfamily protein [Longimicrobiaceae bacterium]
MASEHGWDGAPADLALAGGDVHVWRASLEPPAPELARLAATLAEDEQVRAARFRFPVHRDRYVAGRGILRVLLGRYLGIRPREVRLTYTAHGKPALADQGGAGGLCFNVSNTEALGLYAFARGRHLGVDVEHVRPMPDGVAIARRFFSAPENEVFAALPEEGRELAFFTCWTRKEAYIKAVGEGLSMPLDRFDVTLVPGDPARLLATRPDASEAARWVLHELHPGAGFVGALMVEGSGCAISCYDWPGDALTSASPAFENAAR